MFVKVKVSNVNIIKNRLDSIKKMLVSLEKEVETLCVECQKIDIELTDGHGETLEGLAEPIS